MKLFGRKRDQNPADYFEKVPRWETAMAGNEIWDRAVDLQIEYWKYRPEEKRLLLNEYRSGELDWAGIYRLHHLNCIEVVQQAYAAGILNREFEWQEGRFPKGDGVGLMKELTKILLQTDSPYRFFGADLWLEGEDGGAERESDMLGQFMDSSLTHLGGLEIMRMDKEDYPKTLEFLPLSQIAGAVFSGSTLLKAGRIYLEFEGKPLDCWVSGLYGLSHWAGPEFIRSGEMTVWGLSIGISEMEYEMGIGFGQRDFILKQPDTINLVAMGNLREMAVALSLSDPLFDQKCKRRGLDPEAIRAQSGGENLSLDVNPVSESQEAATIPGDDTKKEEAKEPAPDAGTPVIKAESSEDALQDRKAVPGQAPESEEKEESEKRMLTREGLLNLLAQGEIPDAEKTVKEPEKPDTAPVSPEANTKPPTITKKKVVKAQDKLEKEIRDAVNQKPEEPT